MWDHLWAEGPQPHEYYELQLCRMYNCDPVTLSKIPLETILAHVNCANTEAQIKKAKNG